MFSAKSKSRRNLVGPTAALVGVVSLLGTCKSTPVKSDLEDASATKSSDEGLMRVIDCPGDSACPPALRNANGHAKLLAAGQDPGDQTIIAELDSQVGAYDNYALDTPATTANKQESSKSGTAIAKSTVLNNLARGLWNSDSSKSPATQSGLSALLNSLNPVLSEIQKANTFAHDNIDAATEAERAQTLFVLKELSESIKKHSASKGGNQEQTLTNLEVLAGRDGWLNYGDQPRIAAPIPQLVGRLADQKISQTVPGIIAQQQQIYREQLPLGGFFFGGVVDDQVQSKVWEVVGQKKWQAMNDAAVSFQVEYDKMMRTLEVKSYFLLANDKTHNYYDPAPQVTEAELIAVVESVSGKKFADLVAASDQTGGATPSLIPQEANAAMVDLAKKISLPDGIPLQEIHRLAKASEGATKVVYPDGLRFKLLADGRLEIRHNTSLPTIGSNSNTNTSGNGQTSNSVGDFVCTGVTMKEADGRVKIYLYSAEEGIHLSLGTSQGWFEAPFKNNPQPPKWLYVQSVYGPPAWLTTEKISIKLETQGGVVKTCKGSLHHM